MTVRETTAMREINMPRCKLGDKAIIIKSLIKNEGKIVLIIKYMGVVTAGDASYNQVMPVSGHYWQVKSLGSPFRSSQGNFYQEVFFPDEWLRPLPTITIPAKSLQKEH
jgi:hypothetical protein